MIIKTNLKSLALDKPDIEIKLMDDSGGHSSFLFYLSDSVKSYVEYVNNDSNYVGQNYDRYSNGISNYSMLTSNSLQWASDQLYTRISKFEVIDNMYRNFTEVVYEILNFLSELEKSNTAEFIFNDGKTETISGDNYYFNVLNRIYMYDPLAYYYIIFLLFNKYTLIDSNISNKMFVPLIDVLSKLISVYDRQCSISSNGFNDQTVFYGLKLDIKSQLFIKIMNYIYYRNITQYINTDNLLYAYKFLLKHYLCTTGHNAFDRITYKVSFDKHTINIDVKDHEIYGSKYDTLKDISMSNPHRNINIYINLLISLNTINILLDKPIIKLNINKDIAYSLYYSIRNKISDPISEYYMKRTSTLPLVLEENSLLNDSKTSVFIEKQATESARMISPESNLIIRHNIGILKEYKIKLINYITSFVKSLYKSSVKNIHRVYMYILAEHYPFIDRLMYADFTNEEKIEIINNLSPIDDVEQFKITLLADLIGFNLHQYIPSMCELLYDGALFNKETIETDKSDIVEVLTAIMHYNHRQSDDINYNLIYSSTISKQIIKGYKYKYEISDETPDEAIICALLYEAHRFDNSKRYVDSDIEKVFNFVKKTQFNKESLPELCQNMSACWCKKTSIYDVLKILTPGLKELFTLFMAFEYSRTGTTEFESDFSKVYEGLFKKYDKSNNMFKNLIMNIIKLQLDRTTKSKEQSSVTIERFLVGLSTSINKNEIMEELLKSRNTIISAENTTSLAEITSRLQEKGCEIPESLITDIAYRTLNYV